MQKGKFKIFTKYMKNAIVNQNFQVLEGAIRIRSKFENIQMNLPAIFHFLCSISLIS